MAKLRASLASWRARYRWRDARWKHWRQEVKRHPEIAFMRPYVAKWEKLRREAIANINRIKREIYVHEHPGTIVMFDSIEVDQIPADAEAVAGYVGGRWPTFHELIQRFPKAHHLPIAVNASEDAECLDIETGDAEPKDGPSWVRRQHARGIRRPVLYANLSTMAAVRDALVLNSIGRGQVRLLVADYTFEPHIPDGYDGCQWTDRALGRNLDESLLLGTFFA